MERRTRRDPPAPRTRASAAGAVARARRQASLPSHRLLRQPRQRLHQAPLPPPPPRARPPSTNRRPPPPAAAETASSAPPPPPRASQAAIDKPPPPPPPPPAGTPPPCPNCGAA